jgi:hypothetical protein
MKRGQDGEVCIEKMGKMRDWSGRMRLLDARRRQNWSNCSKEMRKEVLYKGKGEEDPSVEIQPRIQEGKSQSSTFKIKHVKCIHCCTSGTHTVYCTMYCTCVES